MPRRSTWRSPPETYDREGIKIECTLDSSAVAAFEGATLKFNGEGTVKVTVKLVGRDSGVALEKDIEIAYAPYKPGEKEARIDDEHNNFNLLLFMTSDSAYDTGRIVYIESNSDNVTYEPKDSTIVTVEVENKFHIITPKKGGFTDVTVAATPKDGSSEAKTYTIHVFVDHVVQQTTSPSISAVPKKRAPSKRAFPSPSP